MKYVTSIERIGIQQGMEIGQQLGSASIVLRQLQGRFGALDEMTQAHVRALPLVDIEALSDVLYSFVSRDEFAAWLLQHPQTATPSIPFTEVD